MVERLTPNLKKKDTKMRFPQEVGLKLAVTLCHLASGNDYTSLQYSFRVSKSCICRLIPLVCQAIIDTYKPEVMKCPKTPEEWNDIAKRFASKWNYFSCVGALDGKHVAIKKSKGGGSLYFNYKKFHSIVLMALPDTKYRFLFVDVGAEGGVGDGGTWQKCNLAKAITNNQAGLPQDRNLPNDDEPIPFHIVANNAFATDYLALVVWRKTHSACCR
ncbi:putative nuclease HARBI1 [Macrobrachium nipponense]|uniref:putative nuclease HARBI1 n=1 Tax=Macrobrachium nipponense TaxID=159736 RepID=UPI0030C7AC07